jgi:hypothetical protein
VIRIIGVRAWALVVGIACVIAVGVIALVMWPSSPKPCKDEMAVVSTMPDAQTPGAHVPTLPDCRRPASTDAQLFRLPRAG